MTIEHILFVGIALIDFVWAAEELCKIKKNGYKSSYAIWAILLGTFGVTAGLYGFGVVNG